MLHAIQNLELYLKNVFGNKYICLKNMTYNNYITSIWVENENLNYITF